MVNRSIDQHMFSYITIHDQPEIEGKYHILKANSLKVKFLNANNYLHANIFIYVDP